MARWLSWLERRPVTAEVVGSNPIRVVKQSVALQLIAQLNKYGILAQLGEHLPYKQRVIGSSPIGPIYGWIPEWPKGTDCKSAANCFGGSNPPPSIWILHPQLNNIAGWSSLEARRAHNPKVVGSNPAPAIRVE